ncbi:Spore maturation protein CgeB [Sphingomonas sp. NFR04]|uniref:CgeB family protein n=1 Tax=Sphingomonas sp. NFR04 TaxID=1566283 RepID=UPI0008E297A9|nr:glycosyltransferase [Sphingomonas sp. NFR04]SFJ06096.1 Spore maturation protein CgeB [Sphingomonas sp. NFR04]
MKIVYFTHSLASCWNHGNAHFLRGVLSELIARGHDVKVWEPEDAWSLTNLLADHGQAGLAPYRDAYPELNSHTYTPMCTPAEMIGDADLVIVHEWNDPKLVSRIGHARAMGGKFTLLFHDTHHRAVSEPAAMQAYDLNDYDGVLAFGQTLAEVYRGWGWGNRVWVWHEAADLRRFQPPAREGMREGLVWIGNWGDGERTEELERFLFQPAAEARLPLDIFGVRYPDEAKAMLARHGARYHGWAPNARAPEIFARHLATVHVPRRYYATILPGIPTIRVFEALACGIPLVSAPWDDAEHLFRPGTDYLVARDGAEMTRHLTALRDDPDLRASLVANGLETIRTRHSCAHRVDELLAIVAGLKSPLPLAGGVGGGTDVGALSRTSPHAQPLSPPPTPPASGRGAQTISAGHLNTKDAA